MTPEQKPSAEFAGHEARTIAHDVAATSWNKLHEFFPDHRATPDTTTLLTGTALLIITATLFERMRYQATGICSHQQSRPAPHQHCVEQIAQIGHWMCGSGSHGHSSADSWTPCRNVRPPSKKQLRAGSHFTHATVRSRTEPSDRSDQTVHRNWGSHVDVLGSTFVMASPTAR